LLGLVGLPLLAQPRQEAPRVKKARYLALTAAKPRRTVRSAVSQEDSEKSTGSPSSRSPSRPTLRINRDRRAGR
jgi:hypothetical protein